MDCVIQYRQRLFRLYQHPRASEVVYPAVQHLHVPGFRSLAHFIHVGLCRGRQLFQRAPLVAESEQGRQVYIACALWPDTLFRDCQQFVYGIRLVQHGGKSFFCQFLFFHIACGGSCHYGDGLRVADLRRAQQFQHPVAVHLRHLQVGYQQVVVLCAHTVCKFIHALAGVALHAALPVHFLHHVQQHPVVVYRQHGAAGKRGMLNGCLFGGRCFLRFGQRQAYGETASFARLLSTVMLPFNSFTVSLTMASPSPKPSSVTALPSRSNGANTRDCCSSVSPVPVSSTTNVKTLFL